MATETLYLDIVSAEAEIFSGKALRVFVSGSLGDLEIAPNHAPLLTKILPGPIRIREVGGHEEVVYVTGGILEVQPHTTTILADTVVRARDFDEAEAVKAIQQAEASLKDKHAKIDYAAAAATLARAAGMLRAIKEAKRKKR